MANPGVQPERCPPIYVQFAIEHEAEDAGHRRSQGSAHHTQSQLGRGRKCSTDPFALGSRDVDRPITQNKTDVGQAGLSANLRACPEPKGISVLHEKIADQGKPRAILRLGSLRVFVDFHDLPIATQTTRMSGV